MTFNLTPNLRSSPCHSNRRLKGKTEFPHGNSSDENMWKKGFYPILKIDMISQN